MGIKIIGWLGVVALVVACDSGEQPSEGTPADGDATVGAGGAGGSAGAGGAGAGGAGGVGQGGAGGVGQGGAGGVGQGGAGGVGQGGAGGQAGEPGAGGQGGEPGDGFSTAELQAFMNQRCMPCHVGSALGSLDFGADFVVATVNVPSQQSELDLVEPGDHQASYLYRKIAGTHAEVGSGAIMPSGGVPLGDDELRRVAGWIDGLDAGMEPPPLNCDDPGRVTIRRLNRYEYDNTVRDLLGVDSQPARGFPEDDIGYGFDNAGDVLSVTGLHVEGYESAAADLLEATLGVGVEPVIYGFEAEEVGSDVGGASGSGWNIWSNGSMTVEVDLPAPGEYRIRVLAEGQQAGPDPVRMTLSWDGEEVELFDVLAPRGAGEVYETTVESAAGRHTFSVAFINDYYEPEHPDPAQRDRNLIVDWLEVEGPFGVVPADPARRARIMTCEPADDEDVECARQVLSRFATRAWRRPAGEAEVDRLIGLVQIGLDEGLGMSRSIELALRGVLLSPHFLYRVELDPDPTSLEPHGLSAHELASRLSYFIWASMPDGELIAAADDGSLTQPAVLEAQVRRMLVDPKARALVDGFADQWLFIRAMDSVEPDYEQYPDFDAPLRQAMKTEARLFFRHFLESNGDLTDMMDADFTFVNQRLADHYEMAFEGEPVADVPDFRRVDLGNSPRGGLLTLGSVLTVTSFPRRTSPVKRGKWVLDQLLCEPPPPPLPGVEAELADADPNQPLRERLAIHRADPECAACHDSMDPLGLGLENFDGIGKHRAFFGNEPVDASGILPDGRAFDGAVELGLTLADDPKISACVVEKLFTYSLGRGPEAFDTCAIRSLEDRLEADGNGLQDLVVRLTQSPQFTMRRGEAQE